MFITNNNGNGFVGSWFSTWYESPTVGSYNASLANYRVVAGNFKGTTLNSNKVDDIAVMYDYSGTGKIQMTIPSNLNLIYLT